MGTVLVTQIVTRCWSVLNDAGGTRWPQSEMIDWINEAMISIATMQPESNAVIGNVQLAAGTRQVLPAGAIQLSRLIRNMGVGGTTASEAPRQVAMQLMDTHRPGWHADTPTLVVKNWMKDDRTPRVFYVYPPMSGPTYVECEYSVLPAPVDALTDPITLDDFYVPAIVEYVLFRSFSKDIELPGMKTRAQVHQEQFLALLAQTKAGEAEAKQ